MHTSDVFVIIIQWISYSESSVCPRKYKTYTVCVSFYFSIRSYLFEERKYTPLRSAGCFLRIVLAIMWLCFFASRSIQTHMFWWILQAAFQPMIQHCFQLCLVHSQALLNTHLMWRALLGPGNSGKNKAQSSLLKAHHLVEAVSV